MRAMNISRFVPLIKYMLGIVLAVYRDFETRISLVDEKLPAIEMVRKAVDEKIGKFTKAAVEQGIVLEAKHSDAPDGVSCFYLESAFCGYSSAVISFISVGMPAWYFLSSLTMPFMRTIIS